MNRQKNNKVVAITGGAGGIGKAIAQTFAEAGFSVAIGDLSETETKLETEKQLRMRLDVTDTSSYENFFTETTTAFGAITHVVLAAGVMWVGPFAEEPDKALEMQLNVNLAGVIRGIKTAVNHVPANGRIIVIASAASILAPPGEASYAATKHGVLGYLKTVREESRQEKLRFTTIMPGVVDTALAAGTAAGAAKLLTPQDVAKIVFTEASRKRARFEVTIPRFIGPLSRFINVFPRRLRDIIFRALVPNQLKKTRQQDRSDYEKRFKT